MLILQHKPRKWLPALFKLIFLNAIHMWGGQIERNKKEREKKKDEGRKEECKKEIQEGRKKFISFQKRKNI